MIIRSSCCRAALVVTILLAFLVAASFAQDAQRAPGTKSAEEFEAYSAFSKATADADKIDLGTKFLAEFKDSELRPVIYRELVYVLARTGKHEEVMQLAEAGTKEDPSNITLLMHAAYDASDQALRGNKVFVAKGKELGERAIAALTSGARPAEYTEETWTAQKAMRTAGVQRALGILESESDGHAKAVEYFKASVASDKSDALTHFLLAREQVKDYEDARSHALAEKNPARKKDRIEEVRKIGNEALNSYARSYVLSAAKPELAGFHQSIDTEFRKIFGLIHSGSMAGIDAMIAAAKTEMGQTD